MAASELFICSSHSSQESGAHKWAFMGSHCCNIWGACECGGQGAYWWVCLLAPLTFTRLTENVSECRMLALVMMQFLKSLSYWSTAFLHSTHSLLLSPYPITCLFSLFFLLSLSSPALCRATDTCQKSDVIGLNNGSYAHSGWNSPGFCWYMFKHEKISPVLHEWAKLCTLRANALSIWGFCVFQLCL